MELFPLRLDSLFKLLPFSNYYNYNCPFTYDGEEKKRERPQERKSLSLSSPIEMVFSMNKAFPQCGCEYFA